MSIVVFGRYEELPDKPEYENERIRAHAFLQKRAMSRLHFAAPRATAFFDANLLSHTHRQDDWPPC